MLVGLFLLVSCGGGSKETGKTENSSAGSGEGKAEVAIILKTLSNPFWVSMKEGIEKEAAAQGVKVDIFAVNSEEDVQEQLKILEKLLKLLEGSVVLVPPQGGRKHPEQKMVEVNTKNILFICGGAFDGIEKRIASRLNTNVVGFRDKTSVTIDKSNIMQYISPQDLKAFGLIPEIIGRLPILTYLEPLDRNALKRILVEPKNSIIKQYQKLFGMDNVELSFDEEVIDYVVDKAIEYKLGARGLRSIVETIMIDVMFDIPSEHKDKLRIQLEYAKDKVEKASSKMIA